MSRLRKRLRDGAVDDRGFTLAELLVTCFLLALVMGLVTPLVSSTRRVVVTERARTTDVGQAFPAMDQTNRVLRGAVGLDEPKAGITRAEGTRLELYTLYDATTAHSTVDGGPRKVRLVLDPATGELSMTIADPVATSVAPAWTYPATGRTRVLATGMVNDAGTPLFTYLKADGTALTAPVTGVDDLTQIAFVRVSMVMNTNIQGDDPVVVTDTVRLANHFLST